MGWAYLIKMIWPRLILAAACAVGVMLAVTAAEAGPVTSVPDPLWQKAADYMRRQIWVPGEMDTRERVYNLKGDLEEEQHVVLGFEPSGDHGVAVRLISAEENGRDITRQVRAQVEGRSPLSEILGPSPFAPGAGQRVAAHRTGEERRIGGRTCIGFAFSFHTDDASLQGVAWLDGETGLPLEAHAEIVSVPFEEDEVTITAYTEVQHYTITDQGQCLLERTHTDMAIEVPGFEGQVRALNIAKKHWRFTPEGE